MAAAGDHDKITAVINLLTTEFTYSPQANHRKVCGQCECLKLIELSWLTFEYAGVFIFIYGILFHIFFWQGGLIGLAAATVGLTSEAAQHLEVGSELPNLVHSKTLILY